MGADRAAGLRRFLTAAARRYPAVRHWIIWGEPTKTQNFQPLRTDRDRRLTGRGLRGPRIYARMLDRAYGALKAVSPANLVIGGNTFTVGTVTPRRWIQALRLPGGRPPRMDLYGHNPFSARRPVLSQRPLGRGYADFGDLDTLAGWLDRDLKGAKPGGGRLKLFLSEVTLPDRPRELRVQLLGDARDSGGVDCGRPAYHPQVVAHLHVRVPRVCTTTRCGRTACRWSAA